MWFVVVVRRRWRAPKLDVAPTGLHEGSGRLTIGCGLWAAHDVPGAARCGDRKCRPFAPEGGRSTVLGKRFVDDKFCSKFAWYENRNCLTS